jgi:hypothetical protein
LSHGKRVRPTASGKPWRPNVVIAALIITGAPVGVQRADAA